jgi:muconolactone D-isomerase
MKPNWRTTVEPDPAQFLKEDCHALSGPYGCEPAARFVRRAAGRPQGARKRLRPAAAARRQENKWQQLYCVVGQYANYSILDVESNDALHTLQLGLPLVPAMTIHAASKEPVVDSMSAAPLI